MGQCNCTGASSGMENRSKKKTKKGHNVNITQETQGLDQSHSGIIMAGTPDAFKLAGRGPKLSALSQEMEKQKQIAPANSFQTTTADMVDSIGNRPLSREPSIDHLFSSTVNLENFQLIKVIGRGSFAKVYLVKLLTTPNYQSQLEQQMMLLSPGAPHQQRNNRAQSPQSTTAQTNTFQFSPQAKSKAKGSASPKPIQKQMTLSPKDIERMQLRRSKDVTLTNDELQYLAQKSLSPVSSPKFGKSQKGNSMIETTKPVPQHFAMKVIKKRRMFEKNQVHHLHQERKILTEIRHPFLVQMHYAFQTPERLYFVLDFLNGGDLFYHMRKKTRLNEKEARFYAAELILALEHLHNLGFIYRDLKPENILLDSDGHIKLADFGLSKHIGNQGETLTNSFCGTPQYLAPEVIFKKGYNRMVDWWGLGILIHEMVVGSPPYADASAQVVIKDIIRIKYKAPDWLSTNLKKLLYALLKKDPAQRLGSLGQGGVESIKQHPFFADIDWEKVKNKEYKPPIRPKLKNSWDTKYFDKNLLKEKVEETQISRHGHQARQQASMQIWNHMHFDNFTFVDEDETLGLQQNQELEEDSFFQENQPEGLISLDLPIQSSRDVIQRTQDGQDSRLLTDGDASAFKLIEIASSPLPQQ
ncbi:hypothetical protein FGO68_gene10851 [Halteria grandinella]|uniref:Serine/threonine protein kinase n=1 Tax=Halteria grandinella TaxID=5974 RepID=A0A8J8P588_HALGN|nr:hypothetical protein FGO68_gene10851 [Halteria grandinella]